MNQQDKGLEVLRVGRLIKNTSDYVLKRLYTEEYIKLQEDIGRKQKTILRKAGLYIKNKI